VFEVLIPGRLHSEGICCVARWQLFFVGVVV